MMSKIYRIFAIAFVLVGILVFGFLYNDLAQGNFLQLMEDPVVVLILVVPFVPVVVLLMLANKAESKLAKFLEDYEPPPKDNNEINLSDYVNKD